MKHGPDDQDERNISIHIFAVSATMVGVCLTGIGLVRIDQTVRSTAGGVADNLLASNAVVFLLACLLSYAALRAQNARRRQALEKIADFIFLAALSFLAVVALIVAYEVL